MSDDAAAAARLQKIIQDGNDMLQKEQEEMRKTWERVVARQGAGSGVELSFEGFDPQIKELFNTYQGQPFTQMMFLQYQMCKTLNVMQLFMQAIGARLAGVEAEGTQKAVDAAAKGQL